MLVIWALGREVQAGVIHVQSQPVPHETLSPQKNGEKGLRCSSGGELM